ncbi:MAG: Amuc_1100 family pilus-like protein [Candidatus Omnitrophota bacterium]
MVLKRNLLSVMIIAVLACTLLLLTIILGLAMIKEAKTKKEIAAKSVAIDNFAKKSKMPLTEESISFLTDERNKLKSAYSRLKLALTSPLAEDMPRESMDSLQFKERLVQTQKKLREEAKEFSLSLPDSLGFTKYETELSTRGEIPALWRRLKVLEELIYLMTLSDVASLNEISFIGDDLPKGPAQPAQSENFYDEVKVSFKINCTYSGLIKFLYKMRASSFIFIVDDLDITRAKDTLDKDEAAESMLQANFLVKAEIIR